MRTARKILNKRFLVSHNKIKLLQIKGQSYGTIDIMYCKTIVFEGQFRTKAMELSVTELLETYQYQAIDVLHAEGAATARESLIDYDFINVVFLLNQ